MSCNNTGVTRAEDTDPRGRIALLIMVLILVVGGNIVLFLRQRNRGKKWSPSSWLLRQLAIIGVLNGALITGTYTILSLKGKAEAWICVVRRR